MKKFALSIAALVLCAPLLARAAEGWVVADISLQAGPDTAYPPIEELAAGTPVTIAGCIDGWTWCDVIAFNERGWVPGSFLEQEYNGQPVIVVDYGARIGIPVVAFSLNLYWDRYYHNRPFYGQRQEWISRSIRPSAPPRPSAIVATKPIPQQQRATTSTMQQQQQRATTTTERQRATTTTERRSPTIAAPTERTTTANTARERDAQHRSEQQRATEQRQERQSAQAPVKPSDAAPQMKPTDVPKAEPQQQRPAPPQTQIAQQHERAQPKPKQEAPKSKDELKAPDKKKKDNGDNNGGDKNR